MGVSSKMQLGLYTKKMKPLFQRQLNFHVYSDCDMDGMKENANKQMNKENMYFMFHDLLIHATVIN